MSELRNLKSRIEELESDLRERDEEVKQLKEQQQTMQQQQKMANGGEEGENYKVSERWIRLKGSRSRHCQFIFTD